MRCKISNFNMGCTPPPHPGCRVVAVQSKGNPDRSDQILIDQSHTECNPRQIFNRLLPAALRFLSFFSFSLVLTPPHPPRVRRCRLGSQLLLADATPRPTLGGPAPPHCTGGGGGAARTTWLVANRLSQSAASPH